MLNIFTMDGFISFLYFLPALLISLSIHEFAHAYVAYKLGDRSQKARGRLTLDPVAHIDWMGLLSIALIGIGWGKPVLVDDTNFKKRQKGNMLVSLAGPVSNIALAIFLTLIIKLFMVFGIAQHIFAGSVGQIVFGVIWSTICLNVILAIFNMIPIPPFDGSKILYYYLPYKWKGIMYKLEEYSFFILLILFVTGAYTVIISPVYNGMTMLLKMILNI